MGNSNSTNIIKDGQIKMITYNVHLLYNSPLRCEKMGNYLNSEAINKPIICLQGAYDKTSKKTLLSFITKKYDLTKIVPSIINKCNHEIGNIIISPYPIVDFHSVTFDNHDTFIESLDNRKKGILYANLLIENTIVSIYNVCLQSDIKNVINCEEIRKKQLSIVMDNVKQNIQNLANLDFDKSNVHLIIGSINMDDINYGEITEEYQEMIDNYNLVDLFKVINQDNKIVTHPDDGKRYDYIMLHLETYPNEIGSMREFLLNEYKVDLISCTIKDKFKFSEHVPCEMIFQLVSD